MLALTIRQPFAAAIVHGHKLIENRTWKTRYRGWIGIHAAGAVPTRKTLQEYAEIVGKAEAAKSRPLEVSSLVGFAYLLQCLDKSELREGAKLPLRTLHAIEVCPFMSGPVLWIMTDAFPLREPIPMKGQLGIYSVPANVLKKLPKSIEKVLRQR